MSETAHTNYVKIWAILVALLVASVLGPMIGIKVVTLITAFGIALVKAYLVARYFMHLTIEKKWVGYLLVTMIAFMAIMFGGTAPDVMLHEGQRWENTAAKGVVNAGMEAAPAHH
jgi:caa(3)-type oxidase subunit IV